jgi:protein-disulfide isomerase
MNRALALLSASLAATALAACQPQSDAAFGERVKAYLLAHPEVLQQAADRYQANEEANAQASMKKAEANLPSLRPAIERDPRDFVANPNGRITVTEFYDYRCPHCQNMAPKLIDIIHAHPDVRFVFKEMPIFGADSEQAAYAALAVRKAGGDYLGLYRAFMSAPALDSALIDKTAVADGAHADDLTPNSVNTAQLAATKSLFEKLALDGTPGFVVGNQIFSGEDMAALNAAIDAARKSGG